jgi:hypothetical protein
MAADVQVIGGTPALAAARLCNFRTGSAFLLPGHTAWLDGAITTAKSSIRPWIDMLGYASRLGSTAFNQNLSYRRCEAVRAHLSPRHPGADFNVEWAKGETESLGAENDNDGYWRAVDVYVYGFRPPTVAPKVPPPVSTGSRHFKIRIIGGVSGGFKGPAGDAYFFQIVDIPKRTQAIFSYVGGGLSIPTPFPLPISDARNGEFTEFHTSRGEVLASFAGRASFYQDPGISLGPLSLGGTYHLSLRSRTLISHLTLLNPSLLTLSAHSDVSVTIASASEGSLRMVSPEGSFTGH